MAVVGSIALLAIVLYACSGPIDKDAYVRWVQDQENGLHVTKIVGDYVFDLQYQPTDYVVLQRSAGNLNAGQYDQMKNEISSMQYYTLTISIADNRSDFIDFNIQSLQEKQQKLYYFSYQFQDDIHVEENGKKLPCVLFHFERPVDLKPARTFVLGFERTGDSPTSVLNIISDYLGGEVVRINISKENIPTLKL